jgi:diketogulonate reductase-like aldo/keto reductase
VQSAQSQAEEWLRQIRLRTWVWAALSTGYRQIDTAAADRNERQVGEAVHSSGLDRNEVFLETKI